MTRISSTTDVRSRRINTSIVEFCKDSFLPYISLLFASDVFFPLCFVKYAGDSQLTRSHPDNARIREDSELPADQAKLDSLIRFVNDSGGVLERDMMT
jgi:hypothetical protein